MSDYWNENSTLSSSTEADERELERPRRKGATLKKGAGVLMKPLPPMSISFSKLVWQLARASVDPEYRRQFEEEARMYQSGNSRRSQASDPSAVERIAQS